MLAQIRELGEATDRAQRPIPAWRRRLGNLRRRLPPSGQLALLVTTALFLLVALAVFIAHWPPGGGRSVSDFVFTQGASLVFVVILLSLLGGPVSASQTLGSDSGWILRDRQVWIGLAVVGGLSLLELWLGWVRPERAEAGASILLTAGGLTLTAFIAWRLVFLSDPINQLTARTRRQVPELMKTLRRDRSQTAERLRRQGISGDVLAELELQTPPETQARIRGHLMRLRAVSERALHDANWDLAAVGHRALSHLAQAYAHECLVIVAQDPVLDGYCEASNDLHAQVGEARGRDFSHAVLVNTRSTALTVAAKDAERFIGPHADVLPKEAFGTLRFVLALKHMANRRLADDSSTDAPDSLQIIGELGAIAAAMGDSWTSVNYLGHLLPYGISATQARKAHIAWPAWNGVLRSLGALAETHAKHRDPRAFAEAGRKLTDAIDAVATFPHPLHYSGFEPIATSSPTAGSFSLRSLAYAAWSSPTLELDHLKGWGLDTARSLSTLARATHQNDSLAGSFAVQEATETVHHLDVAPIIRSHDDENVDASDIVGNVAYQLSWMRCMGLTKDGLVPSVDLDQLAQIYLTDALLAAHLLAMRGAAVPEGLTKELGQFASDITAIEERDSSRGLADTTDLLARALAAAGEPQAATVSQAAKRLRELARDQPYDLSPMSGWGHLHHGAVTSGLYEEAEAWLGGLSGSSADEHELSR
ncbi:MAG: hypothetical protein GEU90_20375 [Gemmatimonas sp.]|nr:hypothetical protein [Gemmatimonas sp.]